MTFHEEAKRYQKAGIVDLESMVVSSKEGLSGEQAEEYKIAGVDDYKTMIALSKRKFSRYNIKTFIEIGFPLDEAVKLVDYIQEKEKPTFGAIHLVEDICKAYAKAGILEDAEYVIDTYKRLETEFVLLLAEHGLKGKRDGMLNISDMMTISRGGKNQDHEHILKYVTTDVANELMGRPYNWLDLYRRETPEGSKPVHKLMKENREKLAGQISARNIALLCCFEYGGEANDRSPEDGKRLSEARKNEVEVEPGVTTFDVVACEIDNKQKDNLREAYRVLVEEGETEFKRRYQWLHIKRESSIKKAPLFGKESYMLKVSVEAQAPNQWYRSKYDSETMQRELSKAVVERLEELGLEGSVKPRYKIEERKEVLSELMTNCYHRHTVSVRVDATAKNKALIERLMQEDKYKDNTLGFVMDETVAKRIGYDLGVKNT